MMERDELVLQAIRLPGQACAETGKRLPPLLHLDEMDTRLPGMQCSRAGKIRWADVESNSSKHSATPSHADKRRHIGAASLISFIGVDPRVQPRRKSS